VIDPVGVGDAFAAGSIHAALHFPDDPQKWLDYSLAAATLKNYIPGDFNLAKDEEILNLITNSNPHEGRE
jgi:2-dehydro-3-deoxygluconokinase